MLVGGSAQQRVVEFRRATVKSVTTGVVMSNLGSWLRERREELHLTHSAVERLTSESASEAANERYRIRRGRATDLEDGRSAPDIFEVPSLCERYRIPYPAVLQAFGMKSSSSEFFMVCGRCASP
jgi:hypothetical protein